MESVRGVATKTRYLMVVKVIEWIVAAGGCVFGGAVRDHIRHNYAHCGFRDRYPNDGDRFSDASFAPEYGDRVLVPRDVDCLLDAESVGRLKDLLERERYEIFERRTDHGYGTTDEATTKLRIVPALPAIVKNMLGRLDVDLGIDIDIISDGSLLADKIDYECNGLVYEGSMQPGLNPYLMRDVVYNVLKHQQKLTQVMEDIVRKEAVEIKHNARRRRKMLAKGFAILDADRRPIDTDPRDRAWACVLCLSDVAVDSYDKLECCEGTYHVSCLKEVRRRCASCPCCRTPIHPGRGRL